MASPDHRWLASYDLGPAPSGLIMGLTLSYILICAAGAAASASPPQPDSAPTPPARVQIPLEHGRLNLADLMKRLSKAWPAIEGKDLDWTIDVGAAINQLKLKQLEQLSGGAISFDIEPHRLVVTFDRDALAAEFKQTCEQIKNRAASEADKNETRSFGLTLLTRGAAPRNAAMPPRLVLLVHGMDDLGFMWEDLIPHLEKAGHQVARFDYPNDGPIATAADLLAEHLKQARRGGVGQIDVVAHSMGGLVVRDVLTRADYYGGDGSGGDLYPAIDRFIMIATPNQGAAMARYRSVIGLGEQVYRLWQGENAMERGSLDGHGEAGVDLRPGSAFLRQLNDRPLPAHTRCTIVAGQIAPIEGDQIARWFEKWRTDESERKKASAALENAVNAVGDGCVPIDSARLAGVDDLVIVRGNHLSILKSFDLRPSMPAAIPVILDRLKEPADR